MSLKSFKALSNHLEKRVETIKNTVVAEVYNSLSQYDLKTTDAGSPIDTGSLIFSWEAGQTVTAKVASYPEPYQPNFYGSPAPFTADDIEDKWNTYHIYNNTPYIAQLNDSGGVYHGFVGAGVYDGLAAAEAKFA